MLTTAMPSSRYFTTWIASWNGPSSSLARPKLSVTLAPITAGGCGGASMRAQNRRRRSEHIKCLSELERAVRHPYGERTRHQTSTWLNGYLTRWDQVHSRNPVASYDFGQAVACKPIPGERPHHEEIAAVPGRRIDKPARICNGIFSLPAGLAELCESESGGRRGHSSPPCYRKLKKRRGLESGPIRI
jgi:hypothetical protein